VAVGTGHTSLRSTNQEKEEARTRKHLETVITPPHPSTPTPSNKNPMNEVHPLGILKWILSKAEAACYACTQPSHLPFPSHSFLSRKMHHPYLYTITTSTRNPKNHLPKLHIHLHVVLLTHHQYHSIYNCMSFYNTFKPDSYTKPNSSKMDQKQTQNLSIHTLSTRQLLSYASHQS
jgi:hypothetical protein